MRAIRLSGSEGGGPNPIESPYPYGCFAPAGLGSPRPVSNKKSGRSLAGQCATWKLGVRSTLSLLTNGMSNILCFFDGHAICQEGRGQPLNSRR